MIDDNKISAGIKYIASVDERLRIIVTYIGELSLALRDNYFVSLAKSIVGQQLSVKAANTIWNRLKDLDDDIYPELFINSDENTLRSIGISRAKISYLKNLSEAVNNKKVDLNNISSLNDDEVIDTLVLVKGIGRWTAEMFLIFSLGRLDVFSNADVGLKRSMAWLYSKDRTIDLSMTIRITEKWKPYRSIASLYLWEIINSGLISKYENFEEFKCKI